MPVITFSLLSAPSKSKGWGRWSAPETGARSRTGNAWLYADSEGEAVGDFTVTTQTENNTKRGARTLDTTTWTLRAEEGAECVLNHRGSPQGMTLRIVGAVLVSSSRVSR